MSAIAELLQDDLNRVIDRVAASSHEGTLATCADRHPELALRLSEVETRLSSARQSLLEGYSAWQRMLEEWCDLWGLADLSSEPCATTERRAA